jgi:thiamine-phosphate pyrophosphorylase
MPAAPRRETPPFALYVISDRRLVTSLPEVFGDIAAAAPPGAVAFQLREKDLPARELAALARAVISRTRAYGARVLVNDRLDVARAVGADGVHLAATSMPPEEARGSIGLIGLSCHSPAELYAAADFAVLGPIYETPSKAAYGAPLGEGAVERARGAPLPLYAIGGVDEARTPGLVAKGAAGVAVISAVLSAKDPARAALALIEAVERGRGMGNRE